ncbi:carboxylate-amine ligase [Nocardioides currus]|uniref:carboxylate-amine ligase n=1 Tax=Nocardioides currus TaxID=2133958 RepID=UPI001403E6A7|nr:YbdK family carboxylate-amine ligase [Nocardioides currus]
MTVPDHRPGGDFTVGVEEELMLVDDEGVLLGRAAVDVVDRLRASDPAAGIVTGEIYADQVELNSLVCAGAEDVLRSVRVLRGRLCAAGARTMAVGVHPTAALGTAVLTTSPRYDAILEEYAGLLRTPTAALQVHVGVPDATTAMLAYRGLRARMPLLRALAAASPFWHGVDSGLASTRSAILRSYPRTTVPPLLRSWEEYVARTTALMRAAEASDHTFVWWDLRPRPLLGTLEVRVMDAQWSLSRVGGLTALVQGIARRTATCPDRGDLSDDVLAVNDHQVARHGLEARVADLDGVVRPLREVAARVLAEVRAELAPDGLDAPLDDLDELLAGQTEPERQRRLVASDGLPGLLADLVGRTARG